VTGGPDHGPPAQGQAPDVLGALVDNHRRFLAFLERRVGSRAEAEDLLQDGFVRALERLDTLRDGETVVAWFYRLLRNTLVDHYRRRGAENRALAQAAGREDTAHPGPDEELRDVVCDCAKRLLGTLRPEYAAALQRVDLDEVAVAAYAREAGITPNNASVRVHRAREALRRRVVQSCGTCAEHGCWDCACGSPARRG
jgi:RNA polymerase sigma-70 factor (ECF subfamily)